MAAVLLGVMLLISALIVWQHGTRGGGEITFGVEDAVLFVYTRLPGEARERVKETGVRRILEWEVFYLQGLAQKDRQTRVEVVAGVHAPAVRYIKRQILQGQSLEYSEADIENVLGLGVEYLASIGAIGEPVGEPES